MSDNTKVLDRSPVSQPVSGNQVQPQMGSLNKEAPIGQNLPEFVRPAGQEASQNVSEEERRSGVEVKNDNPNLTFEHKELGVDHAGQYVPVPTSASGKVSLPMSEKEVADKLKTGQNDDSGKWLAWLLKKVIQWGFKNQ